MNFALSDDQAQVCSAIQRVCAPFDEHHWLQRDRKGGFAQDFHRALADAGWLGSNQVFIDGLRIPLKDRVGEKGRGFGYILHGLNPERILIASEAIGLGQAALRRRGQQRQIPGRPSLLPRL